MLFRDALKHGCYELQKARDSYRLAAGPEGMDADLVQRFIEVSLLSAPAAQSVPCASVLFAKDTIVIITAGGEASCLSVSQVCP